MSNLNPEAPVFVPQGTQTEPLTSEELRQNEAVYKEITNNISNIESNLTQIEGKLSELTQKRDSLYTQAKELQNQLENKVSKIEELQNNINTLEQDKVNLNEEITRLKTTTGESSARVEDLGKELIEKDREISQLKSRRDNLENTTQKDLENLKSLSERIVKINQTIENNNNKLADILNESWKVESGTGDNSSNSPSSPGGLSEIPVPESLESNEQEDVENMENDEEFFEPQDIDEATKTRLERRVRDTANENRDILDETPDFLKEMSDNDEEEQVGGRRKKRRMRGGSAPRFPLMYGGTKLPVWRTKKNPTSLFNNLKREEMNKMASKWGVYGALKYKKKKDLAIAMKLLMHYRYGDLKTQEQISKVARIVGLKPHQYKTKNSLKRAVNKRMSGMKMRGGSFYVKELKSGLKVQTPLLTGGQGKFLTMKKSSYLTGGSQGKFLIKGGGSIKKYQKERAKLEKKLRKSKNKKETMSLLKKVNQYNKKILKAGGCGCMAGKKYKVNRGGSGAPLDHKMTMGYHHEHLRMGNHSGGKRKSKRKTRKSKK